MLAAKDWFRLNRKTDGRSLAWIPEPVKVDTHDEEKMNRVFVLPDHTLVIRNFQPCTSSIFLFYPRDAMLARVRDRNVSLCLSVCLSRAGIVSKRRKLAA